MEQIRTLFREIAHYLPFRIAKVVSTMKPPCWSPVDQITGRTTQLRERSRALTATEALVGPKAGGLFEIE
jgi:hypothetical protein